MLPSSSDAETHVKALILAGGEGTRLRPLTLTTPKPLLPIANRPHLAHILDLLVRHGIDEAVLLTGYYAEQFEGFDPPAGITLRHAREPEPLGTCGPVKMVEAELDDTFLVFNGDVLSAVDLTKMIALHEQRGAVATLYLAPVPDATPYGLVPLDDSSRVERFVEKPSAEEAIGGGLINAGTYVLEPKALSHVPAGKKWSFERELFPTLLENGEAVYGYVDDGYWIDIGTPERYLQAHWDVMEGRVPGVSVTPARGLRVAAQSLSPRVALGSRCRVEAGCQVEDTVMLDDARVESGARITGSILGRGAVVEEGADLAGVILGDEVRVGARNQLRDARIAPGTVLAPDTFKLS